MTKKEKAVHARRLNMNNLVSDVLLGISTALLVVLVGFGVVFLVLMWAMGG